MKKIVIMTIAVLMVAMGLQAQDYTAKISSGSFVEKTISTTLTDTDTLDIVVDVRITNTFTLDVGMTLDSISGNPTGTLFVEGRKADTEAWSAIANTVWSTADDVVIVSHTTAVRYRQLRARFINGGTGVTDAEEYWVKVWYE